MRLPAWWVVARLGCGHGGRPGHGLSHWGSRNPRGSPHFPSSCHMDHSVLYMHCMRLCSGALAPALDTLAPLAGSLTSLALTQEKCSQETALFDLSEARALVMALPALVQLNVSWGQSISGAALTALLTQLSQLQALVLGVPCQPRCDLAQAVLAAQQQVQAGARAGPLTVTLGGSWPPSDAQEAMHEAQRVLLQAGRLPDSAPVTVELSGSRKFRL